jgi:protein dithiol:quinone oxidoreductase
VSREILKLRLAAFLCFGAIGIALISQYLFDMQPCAWCVFQRLLYLLIGCIALICTVGEPVKNRLALGASFVIAGSIAGITSAWYQERVAANLFSCAQTFADQMMTKSGLDSFAPWLFGIYASCMDARVKLLGLEYAWWSLGMFALVGFLGVSALSSLTRNKMNKKYG